MFITDASENMVISFVNPAFLKQVGYTEEEVIGRNYNFLQGRDTNLEQLALFKQAVKEQKDVQITLKNYCRDGSWFWNRLMLGPILRSRWQMYSFSWNSGRHYSATYP